MYSKTGDFKNAISTAKILLTESQKTKDSIKLLSAYRKLADYSRLSEGLLNAITYYQEHKALNLKFKDSLEIIRDLRFMSSIQYNLDLLHESEATAVEAITIVDALKESEQTLDAKIGLYNHLEIIYNELGNYCNLPKGRVMSISSITTKRIHLKKLHAGLKIVSNSLWE